MINFERLEDLGLRSFENKVMPPAEAYLKDVEDLCEFKLPEGYRHFLQKFGASFFPEAVGFESLNPSPWSENEIEALDVFFGESSESHNDLIQVNVGLAGTVPNKMLVIAGDAGANSILLSDGGKVYFFDQDSQKSYLCAENFENFINSFVKLEE